MHTTVHVRGKKDFYAYEGKKIKLQKKDNNVLNK